MYTLSSITVVSEHMFTCKKLMNTDYMLKLLLYSRGSWNFNFTHLFYCFLYLSYRSNIASQYLSYHFCFLYRVMHSSASLIYLLSLPLTLPLISITVSFSECSCIKYTCKASPVCENVGNLIVSLSIMRVHVYLWMFHWRNSWQLDISDQHSLLLQHHYHYIFMLTCISNYYLENIFLS